MRLILGIAALIVLVVLVVRERMPRAPSVPTPTVSAKADPAASGAADMVRYVGPARRSVLAVSPSEMVDVVRDSRVVRPDRRFLLAVADVHALLTGAERRPVHATWRNDHWAIEYGHAHAPVGSLPDLPSLADARVLLAEWTVSATRDRPLPPDATGDATFAGRVRGALDSLSAPSTIRALADIDDAWRRSRDPSLLPLAAEALAMLALYVEDRAEFADGLFARALATSAVARAMTSQPPRRTDILLANALGYHREAHDSARALAADDPVRLFVEHSDSALANVARSEKASPLARYLAITRAAEGGGASWLAAYSRSGPWRSQTTAALKTGFAAGDFDLDRDIPPVAARAVFDELDEITAPSGVTERLLSGVKGLTRAPAPFRIGRGSLGAPREVRRLEEKLAARRPRFSGPLVDSIVIDGYYRSYYYAALTATAVHRLERLSSVEAASSLSRGMQGDQPDGPSAEFARWLHHLVEAKAGRRNKSDLLADITTSRRLGQEQVRLTFNEYARGTPFNEQIAVIDVARAYSARLDSRPSHLDALAEVAYSRTLDMPAAERLYRRVDDLRGDAEGDGSAWIARFLGDTARLVRMVEDSTAPHTARLGALRRLGIDSLAPRAYVRSQFERLIAGQPANWDTRDAYIDYLQSSRDAPSIERITREWLEDHSGDTAAVFDVANARIELSRALEAQRRYDEAWKAVEPSLSSFIGAAMHQGARVLGKLGRLDEARELAADAAERYPDAALSHVMVAEVLWRQRKPADAAHYLHEKDDWFDGWTWRRDIAASFLDVFGNRPEGETTDAMDKLVGARIPGWRLGQLGVGLRQQRRADLAFAMHTRASEPSGAGGTVLPMQTMASLREWRGDTAAVAWLRQYTQNIEGATAMILYQNGAFEELWSLAPHRAPYSSYTWLMRAAAAASSPAVARRHREQLIAHYGWRPPDGQNDYHRMGRHVMGLVPAEEILRFAITPERRCEVAYYVGLRALAEGRAYDAADWFQVVLATGQTNEGELIWAQQQLSEWANQGKSLRLLTANR